MLEIRLSIKSHIIIYTSVVGAISDIHADGAAAKVSFNILCVTKAFYCLPLSSSVRAELASCSGSPELSLNVFRRTPIILFVIVKYLLLNFNASRQASQPNRL